MTLSFLFLINAIGFGIGLAMDAFSVSLANGLNEPDMKRSRSYTIAGVFAGFQIIMPLIGWLCIHTIATVFDSFIRFVPWIALFLLLYIGGKMLAEGFRSEPDEEGTITKLAFGELMIQGIATSIDALSTGFAMAEFSALEAVIESIIIGAVTFIICMIGLKLGRKFGTRLAGKASIIGGVILIAIGVEIFLKGIL